MENKSSRRLHDRRMLDSGPCEGVTDKLVFFQFWNKICAILPYEMNAYSPKRREEEI